MGHSIRYSETEGIIRVRFQGIVKGEEVAAATLEAMALGKRHQCKRFFTDYRDSEFRASMAEVFALAEKPENLNIELDNRFAIVNSGDEEMHEFFQTVLHNRSILPLRYFNDPAPALEWLLKAAPPSVGAGG